MTVKKPDIGKLLADSINTVRVEHGHGRASDAHIIASYGERYIENPDTVVTQVYKLASHTAAAKHKTISAYDVSEFLKKSTAKERQKRAGAMLRTIRKRNGLHLGQEGFSQTSVHGYEYGTHAIFDNKIGKVIKTYGFSDEEAREFITLIRPDITFGVGKKWLDDHLAEAASSEADEEIKWKTIHYPALDRLWLQQRPAELRAGLLLAAIRESSGTHAYQNDLAQELKVSRSTVTEWEIGRSNFPATRLGDLISALAHSPGAPHLDEKRISQLALLAEMINPGIINNVDYGWLADQIKNNNVSALNHPVLDEYWSKMQPQELLGGLLLAAYQERANLSHAQLAEKIFMSTATIEYWQKGFNSRGEEHPINPSKLGLLIPALNLTDKGEIQQFVRAVRKDISEVWLVDKIKQSANPCSDPVFLQKVSWPALDPAWMEALPEEESYKKAGLLLTAYRERLGAKLGKELSKKELASHLNVSLPTVSGWETSRATVILDDQQFQSLSALLKLSASEKKLLSKTIIESNAKIRDINRTLYKAKTQTDPLSTLSEIAVSSPVARTGISHS